jgi:hypothetical protein
MPSFRISTLEFDMVTGSSSLFSIFLGILIVQAESRQNDLAPRGYELLPNARWLEELERDGRAEFLAATISVGTWSVTPAPSTNRTKAQPLDFEFDYDARELNSQWSAADSLAGGFHFEPDPNSKFLFKDRSKRARKIWGLASSFFPSHSERVKNPWHLFD